MYDHEGLDRLREYEGRANPVLSLYVGMGADPAEFRSLSARLKDLVAPLKVATDDLDRDAARAVRDSIDAAIGMSDRIASDAGSGIAVFLGDGLSEYHSFPIRFRDRAVLADRPYLRPLDAMLAELHRYCAVVLDRREAHIFRFFMRELEAWEQIGEEEVRKSNYGGFSGYSERRVRAHAEEVAHRHYKVTAGRLYDLLKAGEFELLLIGGQQSHVEGLRKALHPDLESRLAGTFSIDTHTVTPPLVREHCDRLALLHEREEQRQLVARLIDTAHSGGPAALGLELVLEATNQRAVELLAVDTRSTVAGVECPSCNWLATESHDECPACGEAPRPVPDLIDGIVRAVAAASGTVRHILAETDLAQHQLGALTRFSIRPAGVE